MNGQELLNYVLAIIFHEKTSKKQLAITFSRKMN